MADFLAKIEAWLNADAVEGTKGDGLRAIVEGVYKAIVNLLNALGEWPIDVE